MTPERRAEIAKRAAEKRWKNKGKTKDDLPRPARRARASSEPPQGRNTAANHDLAAAISL
jgi:hypothetical protein